MPLSCSIAARHAAWAAAILAAVLGWTRPAQARTVRVAGVAHGAWATFAVNAAGEQIRSARLARGPAHRVVRAPRVYGRRLRLRLTGRLRTASGRPTLTLRLAPETRLIRASTSWRVSSDSARARFQCRVDRRPWQTCAAAWRPALGPGVHLLEARASDRDGLIDRTPARASVTIGHRAQRPAATPSPTPVPTPAPATSPAPAAWAFEPFGSPTSFANAPLPAAALLSPGDSAVVAELQAQATADGTYLNTSVYTSPITVVPAGQPLTPVLCQYQSKPCMSAMRQMMLGISTTGADLHGGLPIPAGYVPSPASDTDAEAVFYQPGYVSPAGYRGRFYEAWKLRPNPAFDATKPVSATNPRWTAASGGRVVGSATAPGHYRDWTASGYRYGQPGDPDSTYQASYWGVLASGLFIASDEVRREDCASGRIDHAVGLLVHNARTGHVWPAQRGDGTLSSSAIVEGMRLRFPADMPRPPFSNRFASLLFDAAQRYGLVVDDKTMSSVTLRVEPASNGHAAPECTALLDGAHGYSALAGFPWNRLRVIATGSDAHPNQTP